VCFDEVFSPWNCGRRQHIFCRDCLQGYIASKLDEHATSFTCGGAGCTAPIPVIVVQQVLTAEQLTKLEKLQRKAQNSNLKECPRCDELVEHTGAGTAMRCEPCNLEFCFVHGMYECK
jgi:hypothetical protein